MDFVLPKIEETSSTEIYPIGRQIGEREFRDTAAELRFGELVQQRIDNSVLNSSNCLAIWALAKRYDFDEVTGLATELAFENFMDIVNSNEFKYMGIDLLSEFLSNDNINVDSEEDVFHAMVIWLEYDLMNRLSHVPRLIQTVRVGQLNRSFLDGELLFWCQMINDLQLYGNISIRHSTEQSTPRRSTTFGRLFAIGGSTWDAENDCFSVERYCPISNKWKLVHSFPGYRELFASFEFNNQLIIIGGDNKLDVSLKTVVCLDLKKLTTKELQPMKTARCAFIAALLEGVIYVIGGLNEERTLNSAERYDIESNQWKEMASLKNERMYAASAILSGAIFAIGGQDSDVTLDSVECYIPGVNKWVPIAPMNIKRSSLQAGVANHILYVYGGFSHERSLDTLERYSTEDDKWTLLTFRMQISRESFGSAILNGWLFAMGGDSDKGCKVNSMERINLATGASDLLSPMISGRSSFRVAYFAPIDRRTTH